MSSERPEERTAVWYAFLASEASQEQMKERPKWKMIFDSGGPSNDHDSSILPNFCSKNYADERFIQEIAPIFYKNAAFNLESLDDMGAFLTQDILRVGCCPQDHVRRVGVILHDFELNNIGSGAVRMKEHLPSSGLNRRIQALNTVSNIKHKQGFQLDLRLWCKEKHEAYVYAVRDMLVPSLRNMLHEGFVIRYPSLLRDPAFLNFLLGSDDEGSLEAVDDNVLQIWELCCDVLE
jgi:hypothetical protein